MDVSQICQRSRVIPILSTIRWYLYDLNMIPSLFDDLGSWFFVSREKPISNNHSRIHLLQYCRVNSEVAAVLTKAGNIASRYSRDTVQLFIQVIWPVYNLHQRFSLRIEKLENSFIRRWYTDLLSWERFKSRWDIELWTEYFDWQINE